MRTLKPFIEAEKERFKAKNTELWLNGVYVYNAFRTVASNVCGGKEQYFEKPIDFDNLQSEEKEFTEEEKLELQKKVLLQLQVMELNSKYNDQEH